MKLYHGLLAAIAASLVAAPAAAVTVVVTYWGVVGQGNVQDRMFNHSPGVNALLGQYFTARFTFESSVGTPSDGGTYRRLLGDGSANPFTAASLTINGHTEDFGSFLGAAYTDEGEIYQSDEHDPALGGVDEVFHKLVNTGDNGASLDFLFMQVKSSANNFLNTTAYTAPLTYATQLGDHPFGYFDTYRDRGSTDRAYGTLFAYSVTIAPLDAAVPEPATWAFMIIGFGAVGATMRSSRKKAARRATA